MPGLPGNRQSPPTENLSRTLSVCGKPLLTAPDRPSTIRTTAPPIHSMPMSTSLQIVQSADVASVPEFGDHHTCRKLFSLPRSTLYQLASEGKIRSVSLRKQGNKRGRRLFDCGSIRKFLHSAAESLGDSGC